MNTVDRFLRYIAIDTQSAEDTGRTPSTEGQLILANELALELDLLGRVGLFDALARLADDGAVNSCGRDFPFEVAGIEVAPQAVVGDPAELVGCVAPEMVMRVDYHVRLTKP